MSLIQSESWQPITADDSTIEAALVEANIPALMCALVHLTGDASIVKGDVRPDNSFMGDPQGGISPEMQAQVRARALDALKHWRDGDGKLPLAPNEDTIRSMMNFIIGEDLPDEYVPFLESELSVRGEDPYGQPLLEQVPADKRASFHVAVIGSGMSGILAAIRLKAAGIPFTVIEKNANVGGTWYENTYPGCRVDSPNHTYSYS
ncbi:MAG TPA: NAD(P)-binding protein, partial [Pseudomonadales bacterium]|nr:NAD(P)-binding protein [Pseudomonadales bacterium]